ncbi:hypothetical protein [Rubinisphaera sp.]|uniref:hypothetical protein n=1 Tax=Rubinisphaera sp. TaxID=2024857 RepID=UPI000C0E42D5|nr:hypothetical protein [Rubinisphaera sp.]MBV09268.1 hypothetical protein [Rubinisphaera sp.]HCS52675.1 hypothetical protein [Planctomycetaceae bacterium]
MITYTAYRRLLDDFYNDLESVEATLAEITDDNVQLILHLNKIRFDLDGNGKAEIEITEIDNLLGVSPKDLKDNPDIKVQFDRGDVAFLRAVYHLFMSLLDLMLVMDTEESFNINAQDLFAKNEHNFEGTPEEKWKKLKEVNATTYVKEPLRFNRFRMHLLAVCELNHEAFKFFQLEEDDYFEWLPNSSQKGCLEFQYPDEAIDELLAIIDEFKKLLDGKKTLPRHWKFEKNGKGLNLKIYLTDPPKKHVVGSFPEEWPDM